jgi:RNA polymerase sigma-70 factor (ECF subfamily)
VAEAEDVVQDAWLRWQATNRCEVRDPTAFLTTTTKRLAINVARSARFRRTTHVSPSLSERVETAADFVSCAERDEALKHALFLLLEKLCPAERAAYVLREAFDYSYGRIADILRIREPHARQLVVRARKHVVDGRRAPVILAERQRLVAAFLDAAQNGYMAPLEGLFADY